ncbi:MAG: sigma-70 family RNA polymerase sigma factor [Verrucomicrobiota bacterium]
MPNGNSNRIPNPSDGSLLQDYALNHDSQSFARLVARYQRLVLGTCYRVLKNQHDAEEAAQCVFIKLARKANSLKCDDSLGPWLYRVAYQSALDHLKSRTRRHQRVTLMENSHDSIQHGNLNRPTGLEIHEIIDYAIQSLPSIYRDVFVIYYLQGNTLRETAESMGCKESLVSMRLSRGRIRLKKILSKMGVSAGVAGGFQLTNLNAEVPVPEKFVESILARLENPDASTEPSSAEAGALMPVGLLAQSKGAVATVAAIALLATGSWLFNNFGDGEISSDEPTPNLTAASEFLKERTGDSFNDPNYTQGALDDGLEGIEILCLDEDGDPVANAEVYITQVTSLPQTGSLNAFEYETMGPLITNDEGRVVLKELYFTEQNGWMRAFYARVPGLLSGYAGSWRKEGSMQGQESEPLRILMKPSRTLNGEIQVPPGYAANRVKVQIMRMHDEKRFFMSNFSKNRRISTWPELFERFPDERGAFTFEDIPVDSRLVLSAQSEGLERAFFGNRVERNESITIAMVEEGVIEGTLIYEDGSPAAGLTLYARRTPSGEDGAEFATTVESDGSFQIKRLPEGYYLVRAHTIPNWTMNAETNIQVKSAHVTRLETPLVMEQGIWVRGRIIDKASEEPILGASVLRYGEDGSIPGESESIDEGDGYYQVQCPTGKSTLIVQLPGRLSERYGVATGEESSRERSIEIEPGQKKLSNVDFLLEANATPKPAYDQLVSVKGSVVDDQGVPIQGLEVAFHMNWEFAKTGMSESLVKVRTGDSGNFSAQLKDSVKYKLQITDKRYSSAYKPVQVSRQKGGINLGEFVLTPGSQSVSGYVLDADGNPLANASVQYKSRRQQGRQYLVVSQINGSFTINQLLADETIQITISKPGYGYRTWNSIPPGEHNLEFIMFEDATGQGHLGEIDHLKNRVLKGEDAPEWEVQVWITQSDNSLSPRRADGQWTILSYKELMTGWETLVEMERLADEYHLVPVVIFSSGALPHLIEQQQEKRPVRVNIGLDTFQPNSPTRTYNKTENAYGYIGYMLIDSNGVIREIKNSVEEIKSVLEGKAK